MFILVRHAYAGDKSDWKKADIKRPLTRGGRQEAVGLAQTLSGMDIRRLVSSPYLRCRQTLSPLAATIGLPVRDSKLLAPSTDVAALDRLVTDASSDDWVFCTHGENINALLRRWRRRGTLAGSEDLPGTLAKGSALVVASTKKGLRLDYLQPVRVVDARLLQKAAAG
jgi:phosphohistidine phosphatase SixA